MCGGRGAMQDGVQCSRLCRATLLQLKYPVHSAQPRCSQVERSAARRLPAAAARLLPQGALLQCRLRRPLCPAVCPQRWFQHRPRFSCPASTAAPGRLRIADVDCCICDCPRTAARSSCAHCEVGTTWGRPNGRRNPGIARSLWVAPQFCEVPGKVQRRVADKMRSGGRGGAVPQEARCGLRPQQRHPGGPDCSPHRRHLGFRGGGRVAHRRWCHYRGPQ